MKRLLRALALLFWPIAGLAQQPYLGPIPSPYTPQSYDYVYVYRQGFGGNTFGAMGPFTIAQLGGALSGGSVGNVYAPASATIGHLATFANAVGTILADGGAAAPASTNNTVYVAPIASGSDILVPLTAAFSAITASGVKTTLILPPGSYTCPSIVSAGAATAPNNCTVLAYGVTVTYPNSIVGAPSYPTPSFIVGTDVQNFHWKGGSFVGNVFNQNLTTYTNNPWLPKEGVITFNFGVSSIGCSNCEWDDVDGLNTGGSVIKVAGTNSGTASSYTYNFNNITLACAGITIVNPHFINCGQFLWDYGFLWMIDSFYQYSVGGANTGNYTDNQFAMAQAYMIPSSLFPTVVFNTGNANITFGSSTLPSNNTTVSFFVSKGGTLPTGISPGQQYFVVNASGSTFQVSATSGGGAIQVTGAGSGVEMLSNLTNAYSNMFLPYQGSLSGDGAINLQNCENNNIVGGEITSPGDAMFLGACEDTSVTGLRITNAEMGMLWISGCLRTNVSGGCYNADLVYGGSRDLTVEYGSTDTIISGVVFNGGRRGAVLDSPSGLQIKNCKFYDNNNGSVANYVYGRVNPATGTWYVYSDFTLLSTGTTVWANVSFTGNDIFNNSALNVLDIEYGGSALVWEDNIVAGSHQSLKNEGQTISGIYVGRGVGLAGYISQLNNQSLGSNSTSFTIANPLGSSVQSTTSVTFLFSVFPMNANSPQATYTSCTNTTGTATIPATTGAVSYYYTFQEIPN